MYDVPSIQRELITPHKESLICLDSKVPGNELVIVTQGSAPAQRCSLPGDASLRSYPGGCVGTWRGAIASRGDAAAPVELEVVGAKAEDTWGSARACAHPSQRTLSTETYSRDVGDGRVGRGAGRGEVARPAALEQAGAEVRADTSDTAGALDEGPVPLAEGSTDCTAGQVRRKKGCVGGPSKRRTYRRLYPPHRSRTQRRKMCRLRTLRTHPYTREARSPAWGAREADQRSSPRAKNGTLVVVLRDRRKQTVDCVICWHSIAASVIYQGTHFPPPREDHRLTQLYYRKV